MNILVINPIPYTSETEHIVKSDSIKDTMIYGLCSAFVNAGHDVVLFLAEPYRPNYDEIYPFKVIWSPCAMKKLFKVHRIPYMPELSKYIRNNIKMIDMIISGEVFAIHSLTAVVTGKEKTVIWHELSKHNNIMHRIPSIIWYNFIARFFMRRTMIIPRSYAARNFIMQYCKNVSSTIIGHGIDLEKFSFCGDKGDYFIVVSQLIRRKKIDGILRVFYDYCSKHVHDHRKLIIVGEGEEREELHKLKNELDLNDSVVFLGKLNHEKMVPYLQHARAMLINTEKDNSMISIVESIACGTPIISTTVPHNVPYIREGNLGIIADNWGSDELVAIDRFNAKYVENCKHFRHKLSNEAIVEDFINVFSSKRKCLEK